MTTAIAEVLRTDNLDVDTLLELSRRTDPGGVLSIYMDARPGALRAASIDIKNRLAELERSLRATDSSDRARAVVNPRLEAEIERLTDPEEPGRGRILFVSIDDQAVTRLFESAPAS